MSLSLILDEISETLKYNHWFFVFLLSDQFIKNYVSSVPEYFTHFILRIIFTCFHSLFLSFHLQLSLAFLFDLLDFLFIRRCDFLHLNWRRWLFDQGTKDLLSYLSSSLLILLFQHFDPISIWKLSYNEFKFPSELDFDFWEGWRLIWIKGIIIVVIRKS